MTPFDPRLPIIAAEARVKTCHVFHCWQAMREAGKSFHIAAFALFAGLSEAHVSAIITALDAHDALPEKRAVATRRALRLGDDWQAPPEWIEWASKERHWNPDEARAEAEIFGNYWQAKGGKDAAKLDWRKTWMNWVRNSRRANGEYNVGAETSPESFLATMRSALARYQALGKEADIERVQAQIARFERRSNVIPMKRDRTG
jgi:hypothetical protein